MLWIALAQVKRMRHRFKGLNVRRNPKNAMLTRSAMITRACSASSLISSTHPVNVSLRHISTGSHQIMEATRTVDEGRDLEDQLKQHHGKPEEEEEEEES